jgi:hypothetical protein
MAELIVVCAVIGVILLFLFSIIRNFGRGITKIQRVVPMQRDLQIARRVISKDLLSAPRYSIGNAVPNPGFESVPTRVSTFTPTTAGFWACPPVRPRLGLRQTGQGFVSARSGYFLNGRYGLTIVFNHRTSDQMAYSSTFTLLNGVDYLYGSWVKSQGNPDEPASLLVHGAAAPWPVSSFSTETVSSVWRFIVSSFTANGLFNYRMEAGLLPNAGSSSQGAFCFDDIIVTPLAVALTPGSPPFEFDRFQIDSSGVAQRERTRYRVVASGSGGRLVRERRVGSGWVGMDAVNKIRRLEFGWDFGQGSPGVLPPVADWAVLFSKGMNFPLIVKVETGDLGATGDQTLALTFSVFPEAP